MARREWTFRGAGARRDAGRVRFRHRDEIWRDFPDLVPAVLFLDGITPDADVSRSVAVHTATALDRLGRGGESGMPEIQAWRRAFAAQGIRPTQYRCASESLLRRLRREGALPALHPLVDVCNAISVAYAVPVAAIDIDRVSGGLEVGYASGTETYVTFAGDVEHPDPREVIFADAGGYAHARRWTNRQSGRSAIRTGTTRALIVAEGLHETAGADVAKLLDALAEALREAWGVAPATAILTADRPAFDTAG
ncbi:phenylalanine--tRNA ligase beta subunit-related protein [Dactylosporangium darangshiense]|uniref:Phenylalanine--tRNA ligase beta subunit-related protein n=1 Tax=Dactylosporangium darangshiense TaxID=579108 RepID=A0ABP8DC13_9ACTN